MIRSGVSVRPVRCRRLEQFAKGVAQEIVVFDQHDPARRSSGRHPIHARHGRRLAWVGGRRSPTEVGVEPNTIQEGGQFADPPERCVGVGVPGLRFEGGADIGDGLESEAGPRALRVVPKALHRPEVIPGRHRIGLLGTGGGAAGNCRRSRVTLRTLRGTVHRPPWKRRRTTRQGRRTTGQGARPRVKARRSTSRHRMTTRPRSRTGGAGWRDSARLERPYALTPLTLELLRQGNEGVVRSKRIQPPVRGEQWIARGWPSQSFLYLGLAPVEQSARVPVPSPPRLLRPRVPSAECRARKVPPPRRVSMLQLTQEHPN